MKKIIFSLFLFLIVITTASAEVVVNGDFETGDYTGWTQAGYTTGQSIQGTIVQEGSYAYKVTHGSNAPWGTELYQTVDLTDIHTLVVYTKITNAGATYMNVQVSGDVMAQYSSVHDWTMREYDVTAYSGSHQIKLETYSNPFSIITCYFDNITTDGGGSYPHGLTLNQTYYTYPEMVGVDYNITGFNTTYYEYWVNIEATYDDINWFTVNEEYIEINTQEGELNFTVVNAGSQLPRTVRAVLFGYYKFTGNIYTLKYSDTAMYNPESVAPGSVWMDQAVYDTGDTATVNYETSSDAAYVIVRKYPKAVWSQGEYYIWDVLAGSGTRTFVIPPSGTGDWKAELSESDVTVNETMFSVNETTTPFLAWDDIDGVIGESQILHFYSNDVNATLQIYDGDQTVIYDETVGDGYFHDYVISTHTNQAPGTWTASLNCSGSYYNDTLLMYAKDAYVSFDADSYTLGQTISIQYYLKRSTQTIVLYDANNKDVITWTITGNYIHLGSGSVDFTLSDDNEYGLDIVAGVDANDIKLGLWKVEVLDRGQPITDNPVYDSAKVSESIDDPADVSNEMISIFFSPEGVFLIFTAALTMMGLVAAHHPAGGGAGAIVGVGFGVYFNVLPVWMLLLMVIALVVLAGVSVAVYFKGK